MRRLLTHVRPTGARCHFRRGGSGPSILLQNADLRLSQTCGYRMMTFLRELGGFLVRYIDQVLIWRAWRCGKLRVPHGRVIRLF